MPRLSLYRPQQGNDYRFFDKTIKEMMTTGATDFYVYKYLGPSDQGPSDDFTQPQYDTLSPTNIQDLMFLENRDRVYSENIYRLRGHYNVANIDFNLSQFGLFLNNDTIFITFHFNDMIDILGRKLMVGDVFELPHLTDYHPLNETIPTSLRRYYQVTDANYASEGFSPTWFYHLWRVKAEPLVDAEEFANILDRPINTDNWLGPWDPAKGYPPGYVVSYGGKNWTNPGPGTIPPGVIPSLDPGNPWKPDEKETLQDILSTYNTNLKINDAAIAEATRLVPQIGYDRKQLYLVPTLIDGQPAGPINVIENNGAPVQVQAPLQAVATRFGTSFALRFTREQIAALSVQMTGLDLQVAIEQGHTIGLQAAVTEPEVMEGGSRKASGDIILLATDVGTITGPYGTADNTYALADAYLNWSISATATAIYSTVIRTITGVNALPGNEDMVPGLLVSATTPIAAGGTVPVFAANTRVVQVIDEYTFVVDTPTINYMPASTTITVNPDFTGTISQQMDWRADCDPRFQFIKRGSPRAFGYINGYLTGTDQFPNGLPFGSGITFPSGAQVGDYFLRTDYLPQQLFRFDGALWVKISENVRTAFGFDEDSKNQLSTFINNRKRTELLNGQTIPERQSLSQALRIKPD